MKSLAIKKLSKARKELNSMIMKFETNEYCIDIIFQSKKIQKILREVDVILVNDHLNKSANQFIESNLSQTYLKEIMKGVKFL